MNENEIVINTFEEFEKQALSLISELDRAKTVGKLNTFDNVFFRGHANANWKLQTTLERYTQSPAYSEKKYFRNLHQIVGLVNSYNNQSWVLPDLRDVNINYHQAPSGIEFMIYLRQFGFPSPLLDWTTSLYIACFFAFNDCSLDDEYVAIYAFQEGKDNIGNPYVTIGPYIQTDKRHFIQQARYTVSRGQESDDNLNYTSHDINCFTKGDSYLKKYLIPTKERNKVLKKLNLMNINAHTLFNNEEGLMLKLAFDIFNE